MHLLIPYVHLADHSDPLLNEFSYGRTGQRARLLKTTLSKGDYVFFHTSQGGKKCITAYYVVDRVLDTVAACQEKAIVAKYRNPHILECLRGVRPRDDDDDVIVFGDPITSRVLDRALPFDKSLAERLSLDIRFPKGRPETQVIGSATRAWRKLTDRDVEVLLAAIRREEERPRPASLLSTDEVAETVEKNIEDLIANNPKLVGRGLHLAGRQVPIAAGRIDVLLEDEQGNLTVVEVKLGHVGRDAVQQVRNYMHALREEGKKSVSGVLVCAGVRPAYESDLRKQRQVQILVYGWDLRVQPWPSRARVRL